MQDFAERGQRIAQAFIKRQESHDGFQMSDASVVSKAFLELAQQLMSNPVKILETQAKLWNDYAELWQATAKRMAGEEAEVVAKPEQGDRRFQDEAWNDQVVFDFIKQSYLLTSDWMKHTVRDVEGLDDKTAQKVQFYTRQWVDALSPSNFVATNPVVLRETAESGGENLLHGMENLLTDLEKGKGELKISMTDEAAFTLGENVATSPGKVVFQNDLMQLIQYEPTTKTVRDVPLMIVPPWINKFYVLDLQPNNSFIKWNVDQGNTVFVISWVNPGAELSQKAFDDYMLEGPIEALGAIEKATGQKKVNIVGYCIGGTLTASTLAYMAARKDNRIQSATFLTTMVDFSDPGELGVFIDEEQLDLMEEHMREKGYLEGSHMSSVFNMMRDNDLIWSFVVNNYLMGRRPLPFDLLYWNSDSTRMPVMMHSFYLRNMYLKNKLVEPGGVSLAGEPIDLTKIKTPTYILSTLDDHIAPWQSTYAATGLYSGPKRFVLSASGHIAGVVNPPEKEKYCYWTNPKIPKDPKKWQEDAKQHKGSWWPDWDKWLKKHSGGKDVKARKPGDGKLKPIEDAPGSYVKVRIRE
ncbi:MAG: class I poly(R)-hydroxyalkanoic acid synthase [Rhodospirillales bacterium]|nr:class I poly(R)-hydroxyalkanoic acid synthase [Rhodospirillales bacterium]